MMHIQSQPTAEGSDPSTNDDIYDDVLGRRSSYITKMGYAVVTPSSSRASHISCDARLHEVKRRHEKERCRHDEEIVALQHANARLTSQLEALGVKLDGLYRCMPSLSTPDILTNAYDHVSIDDDDGCPPVIGIILYYFYLYIFII